MKERRRADYLTEKISSPDSIEFLLLPQNDAFHYSKIPSALDSTSSGNHISNGDGDYAASNSHDTLESSLADL
ncbi:parafibromin [Pyrus ussuriensis x Pyrus communis]|uniref:Parafibromin n=1 Tax=Pyrus ussuriensis x Pyrus communis TaxID=2448454 RepID=A0A5N5HKM1_9ROSA|nr:parafibromin [Pyrus ussuriensis x Pyrus communis]